MSKTTTLRGGLGKSTNIEFETDVDETPIPRPKPPATPGRVTNTLTCDDENEETTTTEEKENEMVTKKGNNGTTTTRRIRVKPGAKTPTIDVPKNGTAVVSFESDEPKVTVKTEKVEVAPPPPPGLVELKVDPDPIKAAGDAVVKDRADKIARWVVTGALLLVLGSVVLFGAAALVMFVGVAGLSVFFAHPLQERIAAGLHKAVSVSAWMRAGYFGGLTAVTAMSVVAGIIPAAGMFGFVLLISLGLNAMVNELKSEMDAKKAEVAAAIKDVVVVESVTTTEESE